MAAFRAYLELTKPGRTIANGLTALAGFLLAANGHIRWALLLTTLIGVCLIVASAGAFNNYFDRGIDSHMQRTKKRVLVRQQVSPHAAVMYASLLGAVGFGLLIGYTNWLVVLAGIVGMVDYLVFYGLSKRRTAYSTLIGSICGATPIFAGYTAASGRFNTAALLLFIIMLAWQMPHFYAIAIYRRNDYAKASLPIWSVEKGVAATRLQILLFCIVFLAAIVALPLLGYASLTFLVVAGLLGVWWLYKAAKGWRAANLDAWARGMFGYSLVVLLGFSAAMALNAWLV